MRPKSIKTRAYKLVSIWMVAFSSITISAFDLDNFNQDNAVELGQDLIKMPYGLLRL